MWVSAYQAESRLRRYVNAAELHFGTVDSSAYGMVLTDVQIWRTPELTYNSVQIPGRHGTLLMDGMSLKNVDVKYTFAIPYEFKHRYDMFVNDLLSQTGYQKVWDSISPDVYRMGVVMTGMEPVVSNQGAFGQVEIIINCKPQRYLVAGDTAIRLSATPSFLTNQYHMPALPLIKVNGITHGTLQIGRYTVKIKALVKDRPIYLDSELQNAYSKTGDGAIENRNTDIFAPEFPRLVSGENSIVFDRGITSIEITPRWWKV